jgi:hypothetical protein
MRDHPPRSIIAASSPPNPSKALSVEIANALRHAPPTPPAARRRRVIGWA